MTKESTKIGVFTLNLDKKQLINWMPAIAFLIIIIIFFIPFAAGEIVFIGFILGSLGKAMYPYYRKWKLDDEVLIFNYAYLMPVLIAVSVAALSYLSGFIYYIVPANAPTWLAYGGAIIFAFGGVEMLNELMKYWSLFEDQWAFRTQEIPDYTDTSSVPYVPLVEEDDDEESNLDVETEEINKINF